MGKIVLTDELLDEFYDDFVKYKELFKRWNLNNNTTFEIFVEAEMTLLYTRIKRNRQNDKKRGIFKWLKLKQRKVNVKR